MAINRPRGVYKVRAALDGAVQNWIWVRQTESLLDQSAYVQADGAPPLDDLPNPPAEQIRFSIELYRRLGREITNYKAQLARFRKWIPNSDEIIDTPTRFFFGFAELQQAIFINQESRRRLWGDLARMVDPSAAAGSREE